MRKNTRVAQRQEPKSVNWQSVAQNTNGILDLKAPVNFKDEKCENVFNNWLKRFRDEWQNTTANINTGNSIAQYNDFILNRLNYSECAILATDSIIHNAISKYSNEILRSGGNIIFDTDEQELENQLNERLKELHFWEVLREAINTSLIYGGALIFIDTNTDKLDKPFYENGKIAQSNKIQGFRVIPPYLLGAVEVDTANPLNKDFMKPTKWLVSGNSSIIDSSRFLRLTIFEAPVLLKPLYNFLGISLCQFMKNYVASADVARQSLSDIFLRFKTDAIKSDLVKINTMDAVSRAESINRQRNNLGLLLMTKDEELVQTITPLSGLDKLVAQFQENIAVSARMPAVKLLGLTPSGFNATGEFDLLSYYDEIMSLQNAVIKPLIERVLRILCLEMDKDLRPGYEFKPLQKTSESEKHANDNAGADFITKLIQAGLITQEQAFKMLKDGGNIGEGIDFDPDESELDFDENLISEQAQNDSEMDEILKNVEKRLNSDGKEQEKE